MSIARTVTTTEVLGFAALAGRARRESCSEHRSQQRDHVAGLRKDTSSPRPWRQQTSLLHRGGLISVVRWLLGSTIARLSSVRSQFVSQKRSPQPCFLHNRSGVIATESAGVWKNDVSWRKAVRSCIEPEYDSAFAAFEVDGNQGFVRQ
jgi:hypothetical protein